MKNYSIIEDFDLEAYEIFINKNHAQILSESFIRNFSLIRKHSDYQNQILLTKFKKKVIPRYTQELFDYCQLQINKNRQVFYAKQRMQNQNTFLHRKNRQSLPQLPKYPLLNQQTQISSDQKKKINKKLKSQPILFNQKISSPTPQLNSQNIQKKKQKNQNEVNNYSKRSICGPMFLISPKKRLTQVVNVNNNVNNYKSTKIHSNIYNDSIDFCKKFLFKTTFDQMCGSKDQQQLFQGTIDFYNVRKSYADQNNIQKKMINALKQKKSNRSLKMKIFSSYMNAKKNMNTQNNNDKQNIIIKKNISPIKKTKDSHQKKKAYLGLKGKLCLPLKNHASASCIFAVPGYPKQNSQQTINSPCLNGIDGILLSTQEKFHLPKF